MNPNVDNYLMEGCGRCPLGGTPNCKVHDWTAALELLRRIVLDCGLTEELKWGVPCYTFQGNNVLIVSAYKQFCSVSFFKGALLKDSKNILDKPGENSQAVRFIKITDVEEIRELEAVLKSAFEALTPGRQRGYILYFSSPKQSKTRESRIENVQGKFSMERDYTINTNRKTKRCKKTDLSNNLRTAHVIHRPDVRKNRYYLGLQKQTLK